MARNWSTDQLLEEVKSYKQQLEAAGMKPNTVHTYVDRAERFIKWLAGDYQPKSPL